MFYIILMLGKFEHDYGSTSNTYNVKIIIVYSNGTDPFINPLLKELQMNLHGKK